MKFRHEAFRFLPAIVLVCGGLVPLGAEAQFFQQAPKLVGTGVIAGIPPFAFAGGPLQGDAVSLSGDGNTAIIGGRFDNSAVGAAWVFTRAGGVWSQQAKLVPAGRGEGGASVALSGDGNTAIVGMFGSVFNSFTDHGAAVFTRVGAMWSSQARLVGTGNELQGTSVALSGDWSTAILGGVSAWVFIRSGGVWSQQAKLVGTGAVGSANQGEAVALSGDGNTALVGGPDDNGGIGAVWVFTRAGGVWSQQAKLAGIDVSTGPFPSTGTLSSDGNTAIFVGDGAALIYTRSDGVWTQQEKLVGTGGCRHIRRRSRVTFQ